MCRMRDGLRGALQLLKRQHSSAVKEAQERSQRMVVSYETHSGKIHASSGSSVVLTGICGHLLFWQQKEKETKKLRDSLEKRKQKAKSHELQAGASTHVPLSSVIFTVLHNTKAGDVLFVFS